MQITLCARIQWSHCQCGPFSTAQWLISRCSQDHSQVRSRLCAFEDASDPASKTSSRRQRCISSLDPTSPRRLTPCSAISRASFPGCHPTHADSFLLSRVPQPSNSPRLRPYFHQVQDTLLPTPLTGSYHLPDLQGRRRYWCPASFERRQPAWELVCRFGQARIWQACKVYGITAPVPCQEKRIALTDLKRGKSRYKDPRWYIDEGRKSVKLSLCACRVSVAETTLSVGTHEFHSWMGASVS